MALLMAAGAALLAGRAAAADLSPQRQIESSLMCYCGCADLTVRVCTCGTAEGMRREIAAQLADGRSPEQVTAAFVARYGEKILSAPTLSGFNLVAWITPFAVLLVAGSGLVVVVRRWSARGAVLLPATGGAPSSPPALSDRERDLMTRVEREIRESR